MIKFPESKTVFCFGEILWDILPTAPKPGGAPMNVAYHLKKFGISANLITRVGQDISGDILRSLLSEWGLPVVFCESDPAYPTSEVHATMNDNQEVRYQIVDQVAWDYIPYHSGIGRLVSRADALVFGSLVTRNESSRETLYRLLDDSTYNVFDVNLRAPHYSPGILQQLLQKTNLLKLNQEELEVVTDWFSSNLHIEADRIKLLQEQFGIHEILLTRGSKGATFFMPVTRIDSPACPVEVADTIGSGDSFLAAFLAKKLQGEPVEVALAYASALGAFVTMNHGACPAYTLATLEEFKMQKEEELFPARQFA